MPRAAPFLLGLLACAALSLPAAPAGASVPHSQQTLSMARIQARLAARKLRQQRLAHLPAPKATPVTAHVTTVAAQASSSSSSVPASFQAAILRLVNTERATASLAPLTENPLLDSAAQAHASDMALHQYFSHTSQDGRTVQDRIGATGYLKAPCNCSYSMSFGENIAQGFDNAGDVMQAWMRSPEHRDNILRQSFTEIGIGFDNGTWVQDFGSVVVKE